MEQKAIIIGAGPAGLTLAYELLTRTNIKPIVLEKSEYMGGLSRTVDYKGNKIDIGGHRFFSKSDRVMDWWLNIMPQQSSEFKPEDNNEVMLERSRSSRIFYTRKLFDYPLNLSLDTISKLGWFKTFKIGMSYFGACLMPIKDESNLENFMINRFGKELYNTFFKSYTQKVWGVECKDISSEWGAQRIKGISVKKAVTDFFAKKFIPAKDIRQKNVETSLISRFLYPKYGPGHMWDVVAKKVKDMGGEVLTNKSVDKIYFDGHKASAVGCDQDKFDADYVFSTMPIKELVESFDFETPETIKEIAQGLPYRDFLTVGLLLDKIKINNKEMDGNTVIKDNWIYIQEPDVLVGRLQIFNNWSPYLVQDKNKVWVGLEYFCQDTDDFWSMPKEEIKKFAIDELIKLGLVEKEWVLDGVVIHAPKAYPAYFGTYSKFDDLKSYLDKFENLYLLGRNGMHKYNNQDHAMLTAMTIVDNICNQKTDKTNLWKVNTEKEYHEEK